MKSYWIAAWLLLLAGCAQKEHTLHYKPLSPEESLKAIRLSEDFHVELFAYEPHVIDPVEMVDRKSTRLNSSHIQKSRMPSSA